MYLSHLSLTNFRNFLELELELPVGPVVFFGQNAQGKTSLLEAMYILAIGRSFRAENEHEVVNWPTTRANGNTLVGGTIQKQGATIKVYVGYQSVPPPDTQSNSPIGRVRKQIRVSRVKRTAAELVGTVNAAIFTATDIELVQGPPSVRRRYLDILMSQVDPPYLRSLQRYQRVLQQRNRLLRLLQESRAREDELGFWNEELVKEGSWIVRSRHETIERLAILSLDGHKELTGAGEELAVEYRPGVPGCSKAADVEEISLAFREALAASRERELGQGSSVVGPHRDDFKLFVNDVDMGTYASRGQARTVALTLRLAEAAYLASNRDERPIVLLDDVLSELDHVRRERVLEKAVQYHQTIITTTDLGPLQSKWLADAAFYHVESGSVTKVPPPSIPGQDDVRSADSE